MDRQKPGLLMTKESNPATVGLLMSLLGHCCVTLSLSSKGNKIKLGPDLEGKYQKHDNNPKAIRPGAPGHHAAPSQGLVQKRVINLLRRLSQLSFPNKLTYTTKS